MVAILLKFQVRDDTYYYLIIIFCFQELEFYLENIFSYSMHDLTLVDIDTLFGNVLFLFSR